MKLKYFLITLPLLLILASVAAGLFYFGPHTRSGRREKLLASARLADSSFLFLVQTPNQDLFEPYTVELYRLYQDGKAYICLVGDEESYWWTGGLKLSDNKTIKVTSIAGITECLYDTDADVLTWTDKSYPPHGSRQGDYVSLSNKVFRLGCRF